jgi:hypothetical protein
MYIQKPQASSCEVPEACAPACLPLAQILSAVQVSTSVHMQRGHLDADLKLLWF